ncbi:MAG: DUF3857 and transglutaminase domain-containing protein [Gemmatimonadetes bacterium]|nr:DUF3857 and transglutaminase domain-containing protein [Gemmatimonadota bacterium]
MRGTSFAPCTLAAAAFLVATSAPGAAQQIAGVPPAGSDTIYRLALDTANMPRYFKRFGYVMLLDQGAARHEADGSGSRTYRQVVQVLNADGVRPWAERSLAWQPDRSSLRINWIRVVRPNGEVVSDQPVVKQESDVPSSSLIPIYMMQKVIRVSLAGVAPGTIVDMSWTIDDKVPYLVGDFRAGWRFNPPTPVQRSHFELDLPASYRPRMREEGLDFQRQSVERNGRRIYTWARADNRPPRGELFAPDSTIKSMYVVASSALQWSDLARWYNGLARDRYGLGPLAVGKVDSVVRGAKSRADTLRALHHWIARDLRYVSISLGIAGYQPRHADSTVGSAVGDCKDKATLFIAAARHFGIAAYPVLLNSGSAPDRRHPTMFAFNHVIAAIPERDSPTGYLFTDLTTEAVPPTPVPVPYQGSFLLVVRPDGGSDEVTVPRVSRTQERVTIVAHLDTAGVASGSVTTETSGLGAMGLSSAALTMPRDSASRARVARSMAQMFMPRARGDSLQLPDTVGDPGDSTRVQVMRFTYSEGELARAAGPLWILAVPAYLSAQPQRFSQTLLRIDRADDDDSMNLTGPRTLPIDAALVFGGRRTSTELRVTLPAGWIARLPAGTTITGPAGTYQSAFRQEGREVILRVVTDGTRDLLPKERWPELVAFMRKVAAERREYIPVETGR